MFRQREPTDQRIDARIDAPAVAVLERMLKLVQPVELRGRACLGQVTRDPVVFEERPLQFAETRCDRLIYRVLRFEQRLLRDERNAQPGCTPDNAIIERLLIGENSEQAGFAAAVTAGDVRLAVAQIGSTLLSALVSPITTIAVTLLYFDLRVRKEGLDLDQLAQQTSPGPAPA